MGKDWPFRTRMVKKYFFCAYIVAAFRKKKFGNKNKKNYSTKTHTMQLKQKECVEEPKEKTKLCEM